MCCVASTCFATSLRIYTAIVYEWYHVDTCQWDPVWRLYAYCVYSNVYRVERTLVLLCSVYPDHTGCLDLWEIIRPTQPSQSFSAPFDHYTDATLHTDLSVSSVIITGYCVVPALSRHSSLIRWLNGRIMKCYCLWIAFLQECMKLNSYKKIVDVQ